MTLKDKSALERMIGRSWMYRGAVSAFNDFVESNGHVILSTSHKAIKIPADQVGTFIKDCLPVEETPEKGLSKINKIDLDGQVITDLTRGLMKSFSDIDGADTPEKLKDALQKARAKTNISNSVIQIANTVLKANRNK